MFPWLITLLFTLGLSLHDQSTEETRMLHLVWENQDIGQIARKSNSKIRSRVRLMSVYEHGASIHVEDGSIFT